MKRFIGIAAITSTLVSSLLPISLWQQASLPARSEGLARKTVAISAAPLKNRWVWVMANLLPNESVATLDSLFGRAQAAGYNGVVITDFKFAYDISAQEPYVSHAKAVAESARKHGLRIIPAVCDEGYASGFLFQDPNLAEALPVKDAAFTVHGNTATPEPDVTLANSDFETATDNKFTGWSWQDDPGKVTFADTQVKHSGGQSVRMENIGGGNARIVQDVAVQPYHAYHLSAWIKTENLDNPGAVRCLALPGQTKQEGGLAYPSWGVGRTQDWKQYDVTFNSLGNTTVKIYLGIWGGKGGKIWWDDAKLEPAGLMNVVRRGGCPLTVTGDDGTAYKEGKDFEKVADPTLWNNGNYDAWHTPPAIKIPAGSAIKNGAHLKVSYYHVVRVDAGSVAPCLSEPKLYTLIEDEIKRVDNLFHPDAFMMSQDEMRIMDWCNLCQSRKLTPGQLLADNTKRCAAIIRKVHPGASIVIWSDMYDPSHNARDNYYLCNGTLEGSWQGLDKSMVVMNWNSDHQEQSLGFFGKQGNPQMLAGYYDGPVDAIKPWLDKAHNSGPLAGVMYTTWANNYNDLEAFAKAAWGTP